MIQRLLSYLSNNYKIESLRTYGNKSMVVCLNKRLFKEKNVAAKVNYEQDLIKNYINNTIKTIKKACR